MSFRFETGETLREAVLRVADEQFAAIEENLQGAIADEPEEIVHDTRKRCKKLRGLARLVRFGIGDHYTRANADLRDAARELSPIRDAHALLGTFDELVDADAADPAAVPGSVREELARRAASASSQVTIDDSRITRARYLLLGARARVADWPLDDDWGVVEPGLAKSYRRGANGIAEAAETGSDEAFHEWRKRVKYSWYHVRLIHDAAPELLETLAELLHGLSDALGDDHDLAVLSDWFGGDPAAFGGHRALAPVHRPVAGRRADLQERALSSGRRLYVESDDRYAARIRGYVDIWRSWGPVRRAGEIGDLPRG